MRTTHTEEKCQGVPAILVDLRGMGEQAAPVVLAVQGDGVSCPKGGIFVVEPPTMGV